ncbi:hypothetical protein GCM10010468_31900 [Actinocorallia longicatena]|uniref:Uncharacterized protein n=1 Tax=Actinocorallia longicatena TaxID=111803 RepID=A0ABP6Q9X6_9ACTN
MAVQGEIRHAHEQVLAARHHLDDLPSGEVGGGVPGHPEIGARQRLPAQNALQPGCGLVNAVALGHVTDDNLDA